MGAVVLHGIGGAGAAAGSALRRETPALHPHPALTRDHPNPWHREAQHGEPSRRPLSPDERQWFRDALDDAHDAGRITRNHIAVGCKLLRHLGSDGQCNPSHETLAGDAKVGLTTVKEALGRLEALGLVTWTQCLALVEAPEAGVKVRRPVQTSNAYCLHPPPRRSPAPVGVDFGCAYEVGNRRESPSLILPKKPRATWHRRRPPAEVVAPPDTPPPAPATPDLNQGWVETATATAEPLAAIQARRQTARAEEWRKQRATRCPALYTPQSDPVEGPEEPPPPATTTPPPPLPEPARAAPTEPPQPPAMPPATPPARSAVDGSGEAQNGPTAAPGEARDGSGALHNAGRGGGRKPAGDRGIARCSPVETGQPATCSLRRRLRLASDAPLRPVRNPRWPP